MLTFMRVLTSVFSQKSAKAIQAANLCHEKGAKGRSIDYSAPVFRAPELIATKKFSLKLPSNLLQMPSCRMTSPSAKRKFVELEESLKRLKENLLSDQAELDKILGEEPTE
ncbi:MAG: hypothetical protein IPK53_00005 [bacterium]|nr:hypothetical protein [bacterium]